jgi:beta-phosphoglucomutase-like phosphatase (HAD superfamily)
VRAWQAFFFDFDGVLADSVEVKTKAFARLFEPFGPEVMARVVDHHRRYSGVTRVDKFRHYYREFLQQPLSERIWRSYAGVSPGWWWMR